MARTHIPKLCHDITTGRDFVRLNGRRINLGKTGSPDAQERYGQLIAQWTANHRQLPPQVDQAKAEPEGLLVGELAVRYTEYARHAYIKHGEPTTEADTVKRVMRDWYEFMGETPVAEFGPKAFKLLREHFRQQGLARMTINKYASRIKQAIAWAVSEELIRGEVHYRLTAVKGIRKGTADVRESAPVEPADPALITAVKPFLSRQVQAMIELQLLTAMRPGEIVILRGQDIDRSGDIWKYVPERFKCEHLGITREIALGPKAQIILSQWLAATDPAAYVFSPEQAEAERLAQRHAARVTPLSCGNRPGSFHWLRDPFQPLFWIRNS